MKTKFSSMLGIEYPVIQGGLQWLATAEFCAAVSNQGALGMINATIHEDKESLKKEIAKTRELTGKPFGVNISMLPHGDDKLIGQYMQAVIEEKVPVVETSGRSPEAWIADLKEAGIKIIHKVPAVRFALKAQQVGVDAVTLVGYECGGHPGPDNVATLPMLSRAMQELSIPVIAGGGIGCGNGLAAALSMGAQAVVMGTRFVATQECPIHKNFKDWIVRSKETDTMLIMQSLRNPMRVLRNPAAEKVAQMERAGAGLNELMPIISGKINRQKWMDGDIEGSIFTIGQIVGMITSILPVQELMQQIKLEAQTSIAGLTQGHT
ncbi:MAG: nitronate monooxygenase [Desulfarculales bacterium]|nr:nitronate monooxygenase [Desulfarculales bacterium]